MCGRFVSASPPDAIARYFSAAPGQSHEPGGADPSWPGPRWNVAPTDDVLVVLEAGGTRHLDTFHWGLVPMWAKDPSVGGRMINARSDGLARSNAFKHAFLRRRCIVPADGFYEWKAVPGQKRKQPYFISSADGEPYALAGLWEEWRRPEHDGGSSLRSCTIITGPPNEVVGEIHDRMPVILPPSAWEAWLDPANRDVEALRRLLVPAPDAWTVARPVGPDVSNVRHDGPHLVEPVDPADPEPDAGGVGGQATLL